MLQETAENHTQPPELVLIQAKKPTWSNVALGETISGPQLLLVPELFWPFLLC